MKSQLRDKKLDEKKRWELGCEHPKGMSNPTATVLLRGDNASQLQDSGLVHHHGLRSKWAHGILEDGGF